MLNQLVLVGRIVKLEETDNGKAVITLAIPRSFKNADGEYETDILKCKLYGAIATNTKEYCHKGDIVGVKGRLQSEDGSMIAIAEKVTFLSSKPNSEESND